MPRGAVDIVFNPNAGRGRAPALAAGVAATLASTGRDARLFTIGEYLGCATSTDGETPRQGCLATGPRADCVVTLGGDGTVRAVLEGLARRFGGEAPPIAVLAMGTANLVSRHLHLPWGNDLGLDALVDAIIADKTQPLDIPTANGRPFLLMCSVGFDAQVVHEVASRRRGPINKFSYVPALARSLIGFRADPVQVVADGQSIFGPAPALVIVANAPEYGTGFSMNPNASSADGELDVTIFNMDRRHHLAFTAYHAVTQQVDRGATIMTTARRVEILGSDAPAQIDGEAFGSTPIRIELLPHRQRFIVAS